jgi:hypothetical protein
MMIGGRTFWTAVSTTALAVVFAIAL